MKRKIYSELLQWKQTSNGSSALLIEGARRIGKSYIVEEFARNEYDSYLMINFRTASKDVKEWFDIYLEDINKLLFNLQLHYNKQLENRRSVIVFDEIQDCPRAREAIKFLVADGRYDYIETGSLVSIKKNVKNIQIPSEEYAIEMFPMDFEEFLWAMGNDMLMPFIKDCFDKKQPLGQALHRKAMDLFRQYMVVGGMPQAILKYIETKDFTAAEQTKAQILQLYRNDIQKYADNMESKVTALFDEIPGQLQRHEKKFRLSAISPNARMREYEEAFFWLADSGVVNCCYNTTEPSIGLSLNMERSTVKCYMGDTGLLVSHSFNEKGQVPVEIYQKLILGKLEANEGMLIENIVAQMLKASHHRLFFYSKNADKAEDRMEIDFLIRKSKISSRHNISPIEVKSGRNYTLTSLKKCIAKYGPYLSTPYVIHSGDVEEKDGITYLPLYMTMLL